MTRSVSADQQHVEARLLHPSERDALLGLCPDLADEAASARVEHLLKRGKAVAARVEVVADVDERVRFEEELRLAQGAREFGEGKGGGHGLGRDLVALELGEEAELDDERVQEWEHRAVVGRLWILEEAARGDQAVRRDGLSMWEAGRTRS